MQCGQLGRSVGQEPARLAQLTLLGIKKTERREQSSIFSALAGVLEAYRSEAALRATDHPDFDPARFVASRDTLYIVGPADLQALVAPVVVGLLDDVRRATYQQYHAQTAQGRRPYPVVFALDEVANIAPLPNLPAMISEGGGQGAPVLACLQDLSQARVRWGQAAEGFLSLVGAKLILPGIGDPRTLEAVSTIPTARSLRTLTVVASAWQCSAACPCAMWCSCTSSQKAWCRCRSPSPPTARTSRSSPRI